jgi:hypothetical protein
MQTRIEIAAAIAYLPSVEAARAGAGDIHDLRAVSRSVLDQQTYIPCPPLTQSGHRCSGSVRIGFVLERTIQHVDKEDGHQRNRNVRNVVPDGQ